MSYRPPPRSSFPPRDQNRGPPCGGGSGGSAGYGPGSNAGPHQGRPGQYRPPSSDGGASGAGDYGQRDYDAGGGRGGGRHHRGRGRGGGGGGGGRGDRFEQHRDSNRRPDRSPERGFNNRQDYNRGSEYALQNQGYGGGYEQDYGRGSDRQDNPRDTHHERGGGPFNRNQQSELTHGPSELPPGPDRAHLNTLSEKFALPVQARETPSQEVRLDRLSRERVSRTLFLRNIAYETKSHALREQFAAHGEIKEWFDANMTKRGMIFCTYFDVRASEAARHTMNGCKSVGRPIEVRYSLPKEHDQDGPCDATKNQGSLMTTLRPHRAMDERELGQIAEKYGAIKAIRTCGYHEKRIVEFYDSRAARDFCERENRRPFMGGTLEVEYIWDAGDVVNPDPVTADAISQVATGGSRGSFSGANAERPYGNAPPPGAPRGRYDGPPVSDRDYEPQRYDGPPRYNDAPPAPRVGDNRLEEARKVQDLLANLGTVAIAGSGPPPHPPPAGGPPPFPPNYPPPAGYRPPPSNTPPFPPSSKTSPFPPPSQTPPFPPHSYPPQPPAHGRPPAAYPPPPQSYPPPPSTQAAPYPPPANIPSYGATAYGTGAYPPPPAPQAAPPAGAGSGAPLPPQVLAMLNPQSQNAPGSAQQQQQYPPPQHQGYDPKNADSVGNLLAMLQQR